LWRCGSRPISPQPSLPPIRCNIPAAPWGGRPARRERDQGVGSTTTATLSSVLPATFSIISRQSPQLCEMQRLTYLLNRARNICYFRTVIFVTKKQHNKPVY